MEAMSADWRKSTYSGANAGNCVEVSTWRKSTHNGASCVEVTSATRGVVVRDTKDRAGVALAVPAGAWRALLAGVRAS
jgi:hypothetical protein